MLDEIAAQLKRAERDGNKSAMFHFLVLVYAKELRGMDPVEFCQRVGAKESFATEFRKMINVARLMEQNGVTITTGTLGSNGRSR